VFVANAAPGALFAHMLLMVYRKLDGLPVRTIGLEAPDSKLGVSSQQKPASHAQSGEQAIARRRQTPSSDPLPITFKWVAKLPQSVQPLALLRQFPRIANMMAGMWQDPQSCRAYLHDLLTDRRGTRKGFSPEIVQELVRLRVHYEHLHPPVLDVYKDVNKRG
jgi:hypothetical protein